MLFFLFVVLVLSQNAFIRILCQTTDTLALFSISGCPLENQHHCNNARINEERMRAAREVAVQVNTPYELCTLDVASSFSKVGEVIFELLNNEEVNFFGRCINQTVNANFSINNTLLFTYISYEMTRFVSSLLLLKDIDPTIVAITTEPMYPSDLFDKDTFIYSYETSFEIDIQRKAVKKLKDQYGISYIGVIYLQDSSDDLETINKPCKKRGDTAFCFYTELDEKYKSDCIKEMLVDLSNDASVRESVDLIMEDPHLRVVIVYGFGGSIFKFSYNPYVRNVSADGTLYIVAFEKSLTNATFVSGNLEALRWDTEQVIQNIPGEHGINEFLKYVYNLTDMMVNDEMVFAALSGTQIIERYVKQYGSFLKIILGNSWDIGEDLTYEHWSKIDESFRRKIIGDLPNNRMVIKQFILYWKEGSYLTQIEADDLLKKKYFNPTKAINAHPHCNKTIPICGKGEELRHSYYTDPQWNNSYGWHCAKCSKNTFKSHVGNSKCKTCTYPLQTDPLMEKCFDPFQPSFPKRWDLLGIIVFTVATITALLIVISMVVFFKFRDTPIVKHANRSMTSLHLSSHLILTMVPILFFGQPVRTICITRPLIVGICFTINVSVNLAKTQKLHLIFTSKTLLSKSKKKFIESLELIIIGGLLLADVALFFVCFVRHGSVDVINIYHDDKLIKEVTCNNNTDTIVQLFFVLLLVLANGIQAIRSRGLPSYFKETNHVIYSSFISIIMLGVVTLIYFLQNKATTRNNVLALTILNLNIVDFLLIYSYKFFVIVFRPELNTGANFNAKRKRKIDNQFNH